MPHKCQYTAGNMRRSVEGKMISNKELIKSERTLKKGGLANSNEEREWILRRARIDYYKIIDVAHCIYSSVSLPSILSFVY